MSLMLVGRSEGDGFGIGIYTRLRIDWVISDQHVVASFCIQAQHLDQRIALPRRPLLDPSL